MPRISKAAKNAQLLISKIEESIVEEQKVEINNTNINTNIQNNISDKTGQENELPVLAKKRGRKSKKEMLELQMKKELMENGTVNMNIIEITENAINETTSVMNVVPKKKGRKSHKKQENEQEDKSTTINTEEENNLEEVVVSTGKPPMKKRGRKPKGGKVIQQILPLQPTVEVKKNVIMHLKCSLKDLDNYGGNENIYPFNGESIGSTNVTKSNILDTFSYEVLRSNINDNNVLSLIQDNTYYKQENDSGNKFHNMNTIDNRNTNQMSNFTGNEIGGVLSYKPLDNDFEIKYKLIEVNKDIDKLLTREEDNTTPISSTDANKNEIILKQQEIDKREINKKLKLLEQRLHKNQMNDKKSACFWCTYEFDNPTIYIPKHSINDKQYVYGCFCSPECAVAHLMEEKIDTSVKFERYSLLNHMYSKVYGYEKNIKPAPHPHYILDKYFGNLNIQEYRSLFRKERLFLVIDKPLTHVLPELLEDNDDYFINNMIIPSNNNNTNQQQNKKKMPIASQKQTKTGIINESFGL
jgi:hypothetical protein